MNGPEHYKAGETALEMADQISQGYVPSEESPSFYIDTAQAHFTAALVAATLEAHLGVRPQEWQQAQAVL